MIWKFKPDPPDILAADIEYGEDMVSGKIRAHHNYNEKIHRMALMGLHQDRGDDCGSPGEDPKEEVEWED